MLWRSYSPESMATSILKRPAYRVGQFLGALRPTVSEDEREAVVPLLSPELLDLFLTMSVRDQRHCLDVYYSLRTADCEDYDLLRAALLHDAGKGRVTGYSVRLWHRVAYVTLRSVAPCLLATAAAHSRGLNIMLQHAELGGTLAEARGASPAVVDLIRRHEGAHTEDIRLRMLQAADDSC